MYFNSTKYYSLILCCLAAPLSLLAKDARTAGAMQMQKPLSFVENKGQIADQDNNRRTDIQYQLSAPGMSLFVGNGQLHYQFSKIKNEAAQQKDMPATNPDIDNYRVDVALVGANPAAQVVAMEKQHYFQNYYLPQNGVNGITANAYNRVVYKNVYPHIDWVLYVKEGKVEYDFVVNPGGNPADIKLKYDGASLNIVADGGVAATTPFGSVNEQKPYAYQANGKEVASKFVLKDNIVSFATGSYEGTLTIDPTVLWATYFGGTTTDEATCVATDASENIFIAGYTASAGLATVGAFQQDNAGGTYDAFLAEYNAAGTIQWVTYYGDAGADQATGVACDPTGNVYLTGYTTSATGLSSAGAYQAANGGGTDAFLAKFDGTGAMQWATYYGGSNNDFSYSVACDGSNVYIGGGTNSATGIATSGSYQAIMSGTSDAFVAKFDGFGNIQWATYYGGVGTEQINGVAVDASGNVFAAGQTNSANAIASTGAYQAAIGGSTDAFVAKFNSTGQRQWGTYYGGSGTEQANGIACDAAGNIGIAGNTTSSNNIATSPAYQSTYGNGFGDAFAAMFSTGGGIVWGSYIGGPGLDYGQAVAFDDANNLYITGATYSTSGIATSGSYQATIGGAEDAFLTKFTDHGQILYSTYYGGVSYDYGYGVATGAGHIYVAGATGSSTAIATAGSAQATFGGGDYDAFLARFDRDTNVVIAQYFTDTLLCQGGSINVGYTTNYNFNAGNTFTVQLSDATGSFASPTAIGNTTASASGNITCVIPGSASGSSYRIRIVSSDPVITSPDDNYNIDIISTLSPTTASSSNPVCNGGSISLYDSATYVVTSYSWTGPNGFTSTQQNPVLTGISSLNAGTYSVTTTHESCPSLTATTDVTVNGNAPATPTVTFGTPVCIGGTLNLFANSTTVGATFNYTGPDGFTSTQQNPSITNISDLNSGYYFVTDTFNGCISATDTVLITVNHYVTPTITISTPDQISCLGQDVEFTATITNGGNDPQYQWMRNNLPVIGAIANTYGSSLLGPGDVFYCILTSDNACLYTPTDMSNEITVTIEPLISPTVSITVTDTDIVPGESVTFTANVTNGGSATTYEWMVNGTVQPGNTTNTFTTNSLNNGDAVTAVVHSSAMCASPDSATSNVLTIHYGEGVNTVSAGSGNIQVYPNPNQGTFAIKGAMNGINGTGATCEILNTQGQVIYKDNLGIQNGTFNKSVTLDAALPDGIYMVRVVANGQSSVIRFTLER